MIPYHDENATLRPAVVTVALVALCVVAWLFLQGAGMGIALAASVCNLGLIPGELTQTLRAGAAFPMGEGVACVIDPGPQYLNVLTSMFLHGSWMHLIGNMWFLWLFGNNVEDSMTRPRYVIFYLLCGLGAALAQVLADPRSPVPMVGASGAISGIMGAYLVLYPRVRVYTFVPLGIIFTNIALPAWVMLIYWMAIQILGGLSEVGGGQGGGVAFWAHAGGFIVGAVLIKLFATNARVRQHESHLFRPRRVGWD